MKCSICSTEIYSCPSCGNEAGSKFSVCSYCWKLGGLDKISDEFDLYLHQLTLKKMVAILDAIDQIKKTRNPQD